MASNFDSIKTAMRAAGLAVSEGAQWQGQDFALYEQYSKWLAYGSGSVYNEQDTLFGVPYPAVLPQAIADAADIEKPPFLPTPPDPNRVQRAFGQTLPAIAMKDGMLLIGTNIPATEFYTATNGDIHLALSLRYRYNPTPVEVPGPNTVVTIDPVDETGRAWAMVYSITSLNNRFVTEDYNITIYRRCLRGVPGAFQVAELRRQGPSGYVIGTNSDMSTGDYRVAQDVIASLRQWPYDDTALVGSYILGIRAQKSNGQVVQVEMQVNTDMDPPPANEPPDNEVPPEENTEE